MPNPYMNFGYNPTVLPDMTRGIQALQRAEIEKELRDQEKAEVKNESRRKDFLEMLSVPGTDFLRQKQLQNYAKRKDEFTKEATAAAKQYGYDLPDEAQISLLNKKNELLRMTAEEKLFTDAFSRMQPTYISTLKGLKNPEQRSYYESQLSDLYTKIRTGDAAITDLMIQPPPAPASESINEFMKGVKGEYTVSNGNKTFDEQATVEMIKERLKMQPTVAQSVNTLNGGSPDDLDAAAKALVSQYRGDLSYGERAAKVSASRGTGKKAKYERFGGIESEVSSMTKAGETGSGYKVTEWGTPVTVSYTPPGEERPTAAKFTPAQIMPNGMVQGTFEISREKTTRDVPIAEARKMQRFDSRVKITPDKTGELATVTQTVVDEYTDEIPYSSNRAEFAAKDPSMEEFYKKNIEKSAPATKPSEVKRKTPDGRIAIFDSNTKKFLRYAE